MSKRKEHTAGKVEAESPSVLEEDAKEEADAESSKLEPAGIKPPFLEIKNTPGRLYIIGDIHACSAEAGILLGHLREEVGISDGDVVIFIGDYIDRGADSKGVIELLLDFKSAVPSTIFLKGNHEDMLLDFLGLGGTAGEVYLQNGGEACFASYGVKKKDFKAEEILAILPESHLEFLKALERYVILEDYVVAHAGLNPLRDLRFQLDEDLFWIRDQFINNMHYFNKIAIFGHTPYEDVAFDLPYKIGIDTGLVYGNMLSCLEPIKGDIFQVASGTKEVKATTVADHLEGII